MEKRLWNMSETKPEELVFTIWKKKKGKKNKKVITSTPGRKLRSRELKVCRFSVQAFQEEKQTQPQTRGRTIT